MSELRVEYCGDWSVVSPGGRFSIGRTGDLAVDDNPYLHRTFLELREVDGLWVIANVGSQLAATIGDLDGHFTAHLAPGGVLPLAFGRSFVRFGAGTTTYELQLMVTEPLFDPVDPPVPASSGTTTKGPVVLTPDQHLLVVALAEHALGRKGSGPSVLPSTGEAAGRVGWTEKKFNKKLDGLCLKLERAGVRGLHGSPGKLASNRRARLVEYCISTRLVVADDVALLDRDHVKGQGSVH